MLGIMAEMIYRNFMDWRNIAIRGKGTNQTNIRPYSANLCDPWENNRISAIQTPPRIAAP
jgi:hypothetical protein